MVDHPVFRGAGIAYRYCLNIYCWSRTESYSELYGCMVNRSVDFLKSLCWCVVSHALIDQEVFFMGVMYVYVAQSWAGTWINIGKAILCLRTSWSTHAFPTECGTATARVPHRKIGVRAYIHNLAVVKLVLDDDGLQPSCSRNSDYLHLINLLCKVELEPEANVGLYKTLFGRNMAQLVQAHPDLSCSWFVTCMLLQILSRNTRLFKKILWLLRMHMPSCSRTTAVVCNLHARLQSRSLIESFGLKEPWDTRLFWNSKSDGDTDWPLVDTGIVREFMLSNYSWRLSIIFWSRSRCCPVCGSEQGYANTGSHPLQSPDLLCFVVNMTCEFHSSWTHDAGRIVTRSRSEELASILRWNLHIVSRRHVDHVFFCKCYSRVFLCVPLVLFAGSLTDFVNNKLSGCILEPFLLQLCLSSDNVWKISAINVGGKEIVSVNTCEPLDMIADSKEQTGWSIWTRLRPDNRSRWGSSSSAIRACLWPPGCTTKKW
jgi:hypothetical protein